MLSRKETLALAFSVSLTVVLGIFMAGMISTEAATETEDPMLAQLELVHQTQALVVDKANVNLTNTEAVLFEAQKANNSALNVAVQSEVALCEIEKSIAQRKLELGLEPERTEELHNKTQINCSAF